MPVEIPRNYFFKNSATDSEIYKEISEEKKTRHSEEQQNSKVRRFALQYIETNFKAVVMKMLWQWHKQQMPNMSME